MDKLARGHDDVWREKTATLRSRESFLFSTENFHIEAAVIMENRLNIVQRDVKPNAEK